MRRSRLLAGLVLLAGTSAWAAHPDAREVSLDGQAYTCHPNGSVKYCPGFDFVLNVREGVFQTECLDKLKVGEATAQDVARCFIGPEYAGIFEQLQLMDVSANCMKKAVNECQEISTKCVGSGLCRHLGQFLQELKDRKLTDLFNQEDGERLCRELVY